VVGTLVPPQSVNWPARDAAVDQKNSRIYRTLKATHCRSIFGSVHVKGDLVSRPGPWRGFRKALQGYKAMLHVRLSISLSACPGFKLSTWTRTHSGSDQSSSYEELLAAMGVVIDRWFIQSPATYILKVPALLPNSFKGQLPKWFRVTNHVARQVIRIHDLTRPERLPTAHLC